MSERDRQIKQLLQKLESYLETPKFEIDESDHVFLGDFFRKVVDQKFVLKHSVNRIDIHKRRGAHGKVNDQVLQNI